MLPQEHSGFREQFAQQIQGGDASLRLDLAALYIAGEEYPSLNVDDYVNQLDEMAHAVRQTVNRSPAQREIIESLGEYLFRDLGFMGNNLDAADPDICFLNRTIETRSGLPITLSILYLEVARRLGVRCFGVGLPGNFLVRLVELDLYLDCFGGGKLLSESDCRRLVRESLGPRFPWRKEFLAQYAPRDILYRLLYNLKQVYIRNHNYAKATSILQRMALIYPRARTLNRDLAWCYRHTGDDSTALQHLGIYLEQGWQNPEPSEIQFQVNSLWSALTSLN